MSECRVPVRLKLDQRDSLHVGDEQISIRVQEASTVNWSWELNLAEELLVQVPDPHYAALIRSYDQLAEFIRVHSSDLAVMLLLIVLGDVVYKALLLSICLTDHDLPLVELELKHL